MGCSGGGVMPDSSITNKVKGYGDPLGDKLRSLLWSTGSSDDEAIDDDSGVDRCADITNVVWGWEVSTNGCGEIKKEGTPSGDDYVYTVACWEQSTGAETSSIWFAVLWRDGVSGTDEVAVTQQVDSQNDDKLQKWPAITAHLGEYGDGDYAIIVDVAYQLSQGYDPEIPWVGQWEIRHCRYAMPDYGADEDFDSFDTLIEETASTDENHDCIHPDIVFDSAYHDYQAEADRLHLVYEVDDYEAGQSIFYRFGEEDTEEEVDWDSAYRINTAGQQDWVPRIDVGQDDSNYIYTGIGGIAMTMYYVGVVWMHADYDLLMEDWYTNIRFCMLPADGEVPGSIQVRAITNNTSVRVIEAQPFIDIGPVGSGAPRTTFITWTYAVIENGVLSPITVVGNNTIRLRRVGQYSGLTLVDANVVQCRNGLATAALKETNVKQGYLVWLNDEWSYENSTATDVEVYACDLSWGTGPFDYNIYRTNFEDISDGLSSWAVNQGYTYGPEIAIFNYNIGKCVWTDIDNGTPPSIWGDSSDW